MEFRGTVLDRDEIERGNFPKQDGVREWCLLTKHVIYAGTPHVDATRRSCCTTEGLIQAERLEDRIYDKERMLLTPCRI